MLKNIGGGRLYAKRSILLRSRTEFHMYILLSSKKCVRVRVSGGMCVCACAPARARMCIYECVCECESVYVCVECGVYESGLLCVGVTVAKK